ncbi:hypothetical protein PRIPAC_83534, partial [Pristionchus pacificus]
EEHREAAGRDTGKKVKKEVKEEEEEEEDEAMEEDDDEESKKEVKKEMKKEVKREGKEGSNATDDSELPSSPVAAEGGENGKEEEEAENGRTSSNDEEDGDNEPIEFNDRLKCDHGGVNVSEFRHMVTAEEWKRLSAYFEYTFEVSTRKPVCQACKSSDESATQDKAASTAIIKGLQEAVGDIIKTLEKRTILHEEANCTRGLCSRFYDKARKVLHPRTKARALPPLCQQCVLCDHGRPRFATSKMTDDPKAHDALYIVPLTEEEWRRLKTAWSSAMTAAGGAAEAEGDADDDYSAVDIELCPLSGAVTDQCTPCHESLRSEIEAAKFVFDDAYIYVKMQTDESPTKTAEKDKEKEKEKEKEKDKDKDWKEGKEDKGKDKAEKSAGKEEDGELPDILPLEIVTVPQPPISTSNGGSSNGRLVGAVTVGGRASTRRGASKGLLKVRMSSFQTVKDLKIALLKHVNYSPVDQLLYSTLGGEPLEDELSLMEARIAPDNYDAPIILIVQSGADELASPSNDKPRAVERGFYDTALAH